MVLEIKNPLANAGDTRDTGLKPGSGGSPGVGSGNLLQYSCLEKSMGRGACYRGLQRVTVLRLQRVRHDCERLTLPLSQEISK